MSTSRRRRRHRLAARDRRRRRERLCSTTWGFIPLAPGFTLALSWAGDASTTCTLPTIIGALRGLVISLVLFVVRAPRGRPCAPAAFVRLVGFSVCLVLAFVLGSRCSVLMTFLPTYLQYVKGTSAFLNLPLVLGLLVTSVAAGRPRWAHRALQDLPRTRKSLMMVLSLMDAATQYWFEALAMLVLGIGIGVSMQVLTLIVQNTVSYSDLGVARPASRSSARSAARSRRRLRNRVRQRAWAPPSRPPSGGPVWTRRQSLPGHAARAPAGADPAGRRRLRPRHPRLLPDGGPLSLGWPLSSAVPQGGAAARDLAGRRGRRGRGLWHARGRRQPAAPADGHRADRAHPRPRGGREIREASGTALGVADGWCAARSTSASG